MGNPHPAVRTRLVRIQVDSIVLQRRLSGVGGRLYEILMRGDVNRNRMLTSPGGTKPAGKEALMLDLAFIVLGFVVIAVMGPYAVGLRQL
jgi:hypothetical protein